MSDKTPDTIFHYTNMDNFVKIMESGKLRASHHTFTNDSKELSYAFEFITQKLSENNNISINDAKHESEKILYKSFTQGFSYFLLCFTTHIDNGYQDGLLSMWRGYGNDDGISIGFNLKKLDSKYYQDIVNYCYVGTRLNSGLTKYLNDICDLYKDLVTTRVPTPENKMEKLLTSLFKFALYIKHGGFHEENEYRISTMLKADDKKIILENGKLFIEIPFDYSDITSLIIGPSANQEKNYAIAEHFVNKYNKKIKIECSSIPFIWGK